MISDFNSSLKYGSKFDALLQDINSSALLAKQNFESLKNTPVRHGFRLGEWGLLIPQGVICEVIQAPIIYSLPNTPHWFSGFVNHRGEALPVFYLEPLFNLSVAETKHKQWVLFLQQQQKTCGLLINHCPYKLDYLTEISLAQVLKIPTRIHAYIEGAFYDGQREWLDFSYHPFFLSLKSAF